MALLRAKLFFKSVALSLSCVFNKDDMVRVNKTMNDIRDNAMIKAKAGYCLLLGFLLFILVIVKFIVVL